MAAGDAMRQLQGVKPTGVAETRDELQDVLVEKLLGRVAESIAKIAVNFTAPAVSVAAPHVTVTPQITVEDNDDAPIINVSVPGLEALAAQQNKTNQLLEAILKIVGLPVTTEIRRGAGNLIESTTTKRG